MTHTYVTLQDGNGRMIRLAVTKTPTVPVVPVTVPVVPMTPAEFDALQTKLDNAGDDWLTVLFEA